MRFSGRNQNAAPAVVQNLRNAAGIAGNHGHAHGHGFQQGHTEGLLVGRESEHVQCFQNSGGVAPEAGQNNILLQAEFAYQIPEPGCKTLAFSSGRIAHDQESAVGECCHHVTRGANQLLLPLALIQATDAADHWIRFGDLQLVPYRFFIEPVA